MVERHIGRNGERDIVELVVHRINAQLNQHEYVY